MHGHQFVELDGRFAVPTVDLIADVPQQVVDVAGVGHVVLVGAVDQAGDEQRRFRLGLGLAAAHRRGRQRQRWQPFGRRLTLRRLTGRRTDRAELALGQRGGSRRPTRAAAGTADGPAATAGQPVAIAIVFIVDSSCIRFARLRSGYSRVPALFRFALFDCRPFGRLGFDRKFAQWRDRRPPRRGRRATIWAARCVPNRPPVCRPSGGCRRARPHRSRAIGHTARARLPADRPRKTAVLAGGPRCRRRGFRIHSDRPARPSPPTAPTP